MTLTKDHLVDSLYTSLDLPKGKSCSLVETVLEIMKNHLENKEDVLISGFGKFCVKDKNDRRGRNPATGEDLTLEARRVVVFKCSGVLSEKINGRGETGS
jgi:integration host factor subunit alpha